MFDRCEPILALSPPYVGLCWPYGSLWEPILTLSPPYVGLCWPYGSLCWCYVGLRSPYLALCWPHGGLSCLYLPPMLNLGSPMLALEMLSPIAVTEKAEVGTGSRRGGEGVPRPGRRLGRHASITFGYHRRPPARTRAAARGPAPGFKGWRLTAGLRPKGGYVGAMVASLGPISALCCPYVRLC